jgi:hypothetical protein
LKAKKGVKMKEIELKVNVANEVRTAKASYEHISKGGAIYQANSAEDALLICYHYRKCAAADISMSVDGEWFVLIVR